MMDYFKDKPKKDSYYRHRVQVNRMGAKIVTKTGIQSVPYRRIWFG
jgi:hypothetical protein